MTHTVRIEDRARLEAIVFGRSTATEAERAAATAALRELLAPVAAPGASVVPAPPVEAEVVEAEVVDAEWTPEVPGLPRLPLLPRVAVALVAGAALFAAVATTPVPDRFTDSLRVFDTPPSDEDVRAAATRSNLPGAGPDLDPATIRVVPEGFPEVAVLVYRTVDGDVCLALMFDDGGGGSCATEADFRARGLAGGTLFPPSDWTYTWGPRGAPRISAPGS